MNTSPRPFYWSVRRELWENRSLTLAPLVVTGFVLFGSLIGMIGLPRRMRALPGLDPDRARDIVATPFGLAASVILMTGVVVGIFYCLDALHGERRDRSILFWKSLPVSDLTTVLSKASVPLVVQPVIGCVLALAAQWVLLLASSAVLAANGMSPAALWTRLPFFQMPLVMFYGLAVHALWFAPLYAWLLLVSAWARRAPLLWATLPFVVIYAVEHLAFRSSFLAALLKYRVLGAMTEAFTADARKTPITRLAQLDPLRFLASPGLWLGLAFAAAFLAAAVRLRRQREPI